MEKKRKEHYSVTYSEKEKMILILPPKTGTIHAAFMFNHFDFTTKLYELETEELLVDYNYVMNHHGVKFSDKFKDYSVILTARNPYAILVSEYYQEIKNKFDDDKPTKTFKEYFSNNLNSNDFFHKNGFFFKKTPDYLLRVESLYHDYIQIPFVRNSKLNKSGLLYELCNKKLHSNKNNNKSLEEYYTEDMADYVYTNLKSYFDLASYHKDSWKDKK